MLLRYQIQSTSQRRASKSWVIPHSLSLIYLLYYSSLICYIECCYHRRGHPDCKYACTYTLIGHSNVYVLTRIFIIGLREGLVVQCCLNWCPLSDCKWARSTVSLPRRSCSYKYVHFCGENCLCQCLCQCRYLCQWLCEWLCQCLCHCLCDSVSVCVSLCICVNVSISIVSTVM